MTGQTRHRSRREPRTRPRWAGVLVSAMRRGHARCEPTTVPVSATLCRIAGGIFRVDGKSLIRHRLRAISQGAG